MNSDHSSKITITVNCHEECKSSTPSPEFSLTVWKFPEFRLTTFSPTATMSQNIQNLLKKINYIEADIEIHKQILFSLSSDSRQEIENTLKIIAGKKEEITLLRQQIETIDPEEFKWIITFEKAANDFKKIATEKKFQSIVSRNVDEKCCLSLTDQTEIECLIKACDENGDWTIITLQGDIQHFDKNVVAEKPQQQVIE